MDTKFTDDTVTVCVFPQDLAFYFDTSFCKTKVDVSNFETSIQKKMSTDACEMNIYIDRSKGETNYELLPACSLQPACLAVRRVRISFHPK
jgi:hypothetical protein